jgi:hypothetical protein
MKVLVTAAAVAAFAAFLFVTESTVVGPAQAEGYCPSRPGGKCPPKKKKISKSASDFSEAKREELMKQARALCKKKYGAGATVYRLDYRNWTVICKPS